MAWLNDDADPGADWLAALEDALDADPRARPRRGAARAPDGAIAVGRRRG